jgi:hypothetical protein
MDRRAGWIFLFVELYFPLETKEVPFPRLELERTFLSWNFNFSLST